jgi:hypothetical protein
MPSGKRRKNKRKELKKSPKLTKFFSKTTTDTTSTSINTSTLVSSIAEEKEERSIYAETCNDTEGKGTNSDTSVNGLLQIKTYSPSGLGRVHLFVKTSNVVLSNQPVHTQLEIKILKQDI